MGEGCRTAALCAALVSGTLSLGCSSDDEGGGSSGSKTLTPTVACTDTAESIWATSVSSGERGEILGCAELAPIDEESVTTRTASVPGITVVSGVKRLLVAYRTERDAGEDGVGSAIVYLPEKPRSGVLPILIGGHGTTGLADECAPSHQVDHPYLDSLAVAWAATGLPIIAPDYAGLGTVGVQGYANHPDTGRSMLDAARALRNLLGSERLSDKAVFFGHSQGGGAALAGGAYATERPDIHVAGIIPFAPAWAADITYVEAIKISSLSITSLRALLATVLYADMANVTDDESHAGDAFAPSLRDHFVQSTKTLCYNKLGPALNEPSSGYVPPNTLGELLDPAFVTAALDCADNGACDGLPGQWVQRSKASDPHVDPSVPILYLQGGKDETAKPTQASCFYNRLVEDGASPIDCVYPDDDHSSILPNATGFAIEWAMATANGEPPPECPAERGLPNCSLF